MANPASAAPDTAGGFRVVATSTILILFTAVVGAACVVALACTLTQSRMSRITIDGVAVSIWKLDDMRKHWSEIRDQLHHGADDLVAAQKKLDDAQKAYSATDARFQPEKDSLERQLDAFYHIVEPHHTELAKKIHDQGYAQQIGEIKVAKDELASDPLAQPLIDPVLKTYDAFAPLEKDNIRDTAALRAAQQKVKEIAAHNASLQTDLDGTFIDLSKQPLDRPTRERVENALFELYSDDGWMGWTLNKFTVFPPDILTLALVILMGVLGSALQMTHALFKYHRIEGPGAYCLRLSVGAITALVIFIVAKAGVPVIADSSQLGGDAPINPYFVSFLAIISGLMSENAILSVERQGQRFFAQDMPKEQPRWARYDLHEVFKKAERNPKDMQHLLEVPDDQFESWISGKDAMPVNAQIMLAAVLGMPLREIVTDIAPDGALHTQGPP
jgi:hypothetical protein